MTTGSDHPIAPIGRSEHELAKNTSRVIIQAPARNVWAALTEPALVKQWRYGSDLSTDWRAGSDIRFHSEWEGQIYEQWGKVQAVIPYQRI